MDYINFKNCISTEFNKHLSFDLEESQIKQFFSYMNLLIEKNKVMNLTAITEPEEIIVRHFVDSSILIKLFGLDYFSGKRIVDVGTGAGFPGLPIAVICSNGKFVLTDTLGKRMNFLKEVVEEIQITNVELVKSRAEDFAHDKLYREKFDISLSRGVAKTSVLAEYSLPLLKVAGKMLAYKMDDCDDELRDGHKSIETLGGMFHVKHSYDLFPDEPKRCIVEIEKIKQTPNKYPRKAGTPSKEPL